MEDAGRLMARALAQVRGGVALSTRCDAGEALVPSRVVQCERCGADCWRSLSEGDLIERAELHVLCIDCGTYVWNNGLDYLRAT